MPRYFVCNQQLTTGEPGLPRALAVAHALGERPLCLCQPRGIEMYVARAGRGFAIKRLPLSSSRHATTCRSYALFSNRRRAPRSLRRSGNLSEAVDSTSKRTASSDALRQVLEELWIAADLATWKPGDEAKRSWYAVRKGLLRTSKQQDTWRTERLYIPECFYFHQREAIDARRIELWNRMAADGSVEPDRLLLIGELKAIRPSRVGYEFLIKHVPDLPFEMDEGSYDFVRQRFAAELALWGSSSAVRMILIGAVNVDGHGRPSLQELHLMPVGPEWLPVRDVRDLARIELRADLRTEASETAVARR